jgi:hypothetical protein
MSSSILIRVHAPDRHPPWRRSPASSPGAAARPARPTRARRSNPLRSSSINSRAICSTSQMTCSSALTDAPRRRQRQPRDETAGAILDLSSPGPRNHPQQQRSTGAARAGGMLDEFGPRGRAASSNKSRPWQVTALDCHRRGRGERRLSDLAVTKASAQVCLLRFQNAIHKEQEPGARTELSSPHSRAFIQFVTVE